MYIYLYLCQLYSLFGENLFKVITLAPDLQDGFFPAELQSDHPEGVIFLVDDRRSESGARTGNGRAPFSGAGRRLQSRPGSAATAFPPIAASRPGSVACKVKPEPAKAKPPPSAPSPVLRTKALFRNFQSSI
jgi:hypothetical protein